LIAVEVVLLLNIGAEDRRTTYGPIEIVSRTWNDYKAIFTARAQARFSYDGTYGYYSDNIRNNVSFDFTKFANDCVSAVCKKRM